MNIGLHIICYAQMSNEIFREKETKISVTRLRSYSDQMQQESWVGSGQTTAKFEQLFKIFIPSRCTNDILVTRPVCSVFYIWAMAAHLTPNDARFE